MTDEGAYDSSGKFCVGRLFASAVGFPRYRTAFYTVEMEPGASTTDVIMVFGVSRPIRSFRWPYLAPPPPVAQPISLAKM